MNTLEKATYIKELQEYMHKKKVYSLFEYLYKELIISQPEEPLKFLIERLSQNKCELKRKTIFFSWPSRM